MPERYKEELVYLNTVLARIDRRRAELRALLSDNESRIYEQRRYMWQDMPTLPVSYEALSDLSALSSELRVCESRYLAKDRELALLDKMKSSPYFGRVDFREKDGDEMEFYIGLGTLADDSGRVMYVMDWRAPAASLFYEHGKGEAFYESPAGRVNGEIELVRQYRIENCELKMLIDADMKIDDRILQEILSSPSSEHMKTIVASIQREQNAVIRDGESSLLIVFGPAGSGKTSIALHRIAYLLYRDRDFLSSDNLLIFSPNNIFCDYISHVIPELGENGVPQTTFGDLLAAYLPYPISSASEQLEFLHTAPQTQTDRLRLLGIKLKSSAYFAEFAQKFAASALAKYGDGREPDWLSLYRSLLIAAISAWEGSGKKREEMLANALDLTAENGLYFEDGVGILLLKALLGHLRPARKLRHVVLDEAQDYSPAQHIILSKLFGACKLTLVGDSFQLINPVSDISRPEDIAKYYPAPAMVCRLSHSYRSTIEISLFADSVAGKKTAEHFERHGKPVSRIDYASQGELISRLAEAAGTCAHLEGSTVILTKTARKAQSFYHRLKPCLPGLSLLTEGGQPYRSGLWVIPVVLAKGLEFDRVFVADFDDYDFERDRGLLYVACTRAMHELCICTSQPDLPQNLTERT